MGGYSRTAEKTAHIFLLGLCFHTLTEFVKENGDPSDAIFAGEISDGIHNFGFSQSATILERPVLEFREYSDKMATYMFGPTFFQSVLDGTYKDDFVYRSFLHRLGSENFISAEHADEAKRRRDYFLSLFCRGIRVPFSAAGNSSLLTANGVEMLDAYIYDQYLKEAATRATPREPVFLDIATLQFLPLAGWDGSVFWGQSPSGQQADRHALLGRPDA